MESKKHKRKSVGFRRYLSLVLLLCISMQCVLSGCGEKGENGSEEESYSYSDTNPLPEIIDADNLLDLIGCETFFSADDKEIGYSEADDVHINLSGEKIFCNADSVEIDGSHAVITQGGNYIISGNLENGAIKVDADDEYVRIVLDGAKISNDFFAPLYIESAKKVLITLAENSENVLANNCSAFDGYAEADAVFSNSCLAINGFGKLSVVSKSGDGIASAESVLITGGNISVSAGCCGLFGANSVRISNSNIDIDSGNDGINADRSNGNDSPGFVYISEGNFSIKSERNGIEARSAIVIEGGVFDITADSNLDLIQNNGGDESLQGETGSSGKLEVSGLSSGRDISISGGSFSISSSDNALSAGKSVSVTGGSLVINTENIGVSSDSAVLIDETRINLENCYQGISSEKILVKGGCLMIDSLQNGINAQLPTDISQSGSGVNSGDVKAVSYAGIPEETAESGKEDEESTENGVGSAESDGGSALRDECFVELSGGCVILNTCGDGIASCGGILVSDGSLYISSTEGEAGNETFMFDWESGFTITGGTVFAAGDFSDKKESVNIQQPFIAACFDSAEPEKAVELLDASGKTIISKSIGQKKTSVFITSPKLKAGEIYDLINGDNRIEVTA